MLEKVFIVAVGKILVRATIDCEVDDIMGTASDAEAMLHQHGMVGGIPGEVGAREPLAV